MPVNAHMSFLKGGNTQCEGLLVNKREELERKKLDPVARTNKTYKYMQKHL